MNLEEMKTQIGKVKFYRNMSYVLTGCLALGMTAPYIRMVDNQTIENTILFASSLSQTILSVALSSGLTANVVKLKKKQKTLTR